MKWPEEAVVDDALNKFYDLLPWNEELLLNPIVGRCTWCAFGLRNTCVTFHGGAKSRVSKWDIGHSQRALSSSCNLETSGTDTTCKHSCLDSRDVAHLFCDGLGTTVPQDSHIQLLHKSEKRLCRFFPHLSNHVSRLKILNLNVRGIYDHKRKSALLDSFSESLQHTLFVGICKPIFFLRHLPQATSCQNAMSR